jgi:orotidine-5'-phosphate decarboxylase
VALDPPAELSDPLTWSLEIIDSLRGTVQGFKIGLPFILSAGMRGVERLSERLGDAMLIADLKLADIGYVMSISAKLLAGAGVDAVIAHAFVGYRDALEYLKKTCDDLGVKLILVVAMSHRGASEVMWRNYDGLLEVALKVAPWGVVLPATNTALIRMARRRLGEDTRILSPGVGAQGAKPGEALCAGADYEIVGRLITLSEDPYQKAIEVLEMQKERMRLCG